MAGMLEVLDWEFKTTRIKTLRSLLGRLHVGTDGKCEQRVREKNLRITGNAGDRKCCNRKEDCL